MPSADSGQISTKTYLTKESAPTSAHMEVRPTSLVINYN